jgi:tetratricopeptide (TPR) repeat protein
MTNNVPMTNDRSIEISQNWSLGIGPLLVILVWSLIIPCAARADSVFDGTLEIKDVTIKELKGDTLVFDINGRASERPVARIKRLIVLAEPPLTAAEEAYASEKWDQAVDGYQKTIRTATKQWVKDWASMRLIEAAGKSGRFDAVAAGYIQMLLKDPAGAATRQITMPDSKSSFLDTSVSDVNNTLKDPKLTNDQRRALLGFLIQLQQARKDQVAEDAAFEQLSKLPGADMNDPGAKRILARRRLVAATNALAAKNYAQVLKEIDSNRAVFVETQSQIEALYLLAEARYGLAGNDKTALKDAALAYMRVTALAKNEPGRPRVVDSLLKTAAILEQIGEPQTAADLYGQIATQYPDDSAAVASARANLTRLGR